MLKTMRFLTISMLLFLSVAFTFPVHADMGPKPSLKIIVINPPNEVYYLDLLIKNPGTYDNLQGKRDTFDRAMLQDLRSQEINGWFPALTNGTDGPLWGELIGVKQNEKMIHAFGYFGLPTHFRIITVSKSGAIHISDPIATTLFQTTIVYDMQSGKVKLPDVLSAYISQFVSTFIPTLLIEGLILFLFKLWSRKNLKIFLLVNFATQILMTLVAGTILLKSGMLAAMFVFLLIEPVIMVAEALIYRFTLEKGSKKRYLAYAIAANFASAFVGMMLILLK
jgi:hypothetical protein